MKKTYFLSSLLFIFVSCIHTQDIIDERVSNQIPSEANQVIIETSLSDDELFDTISETLIREGHRIERDRELMNINTEGRDIGLTTYVRYNLLIADGTVTGRADWMSESHSKSNSGVYWREAKWTAGRPARAFASLTDLLLQFEHETFRFK